jgi:large subunit ribosomal protein L15
MQTHEIKRVHAYKKSKLVARGGKRGKTAGKGGKGQTARAGHRVRPMIRDIIKKLPKRRGYGKNRSLSVFERGPVAVVNVGALTSFSKGDTVTPTALLAKGLIKEVMGKLPRVKVLGTGEITVALTIEGCAISKEAQTKIEKAGGKVVVTEVPKKEVVKKEKKEAMKAPAKKKAK